LIAFAPGSEGASLSEGRRSGRRSLHYHGFDRRPDAGECQLRSSRIPIRAYTKNHSPANPSLRISIFWHRTPQHKPLKTMTKTNILLWRATCTILLLVQVSAGGSAPNWPNLFPRFVMGVSS